MKLSLYPINFLQMHGSQQGTGLENEVTTEIRKKLVKKLDDIKLF